MDTARAARAHIIWTSIALVLILIASCLTYVFMSKVNITGSTALESQNLANK